MTDKCDYCGVGSMLLWPTSINGVMRLISICSHDPIIKHPEAIWIPVAPGNFGAIAEAPDSAEGVNP